MYSFDMNEEVWEKNAECGLGGFQKGNGFWILPPILCLVLSVIIFFTSRFEFTFLVLWDL